MKTLTEVKHTPTPWFTKHKGYTSYIQKTDEKGHEYTVASMTCNIELAKANAAFIVRAVNSHEALIDGARCALKEMRKNGMTCQNLERALMKADAEGLK